MAQDFIAAHKWFNLAALRGSNEAKSWRNQIAGEMNSVPDRPGAEAGPRMAVISSNKPVYVWSDFCGAAVAATGALSTPAAGGVAGA